MDYDPAAATAPKQAPDPARDGRILAIDLGLKCGFAVFDDGGALLAYRSTRFPSAATIKKAGWKVLMRWPNLRLLVVEGDPELAAIWRKLAAKRGIACEGVSPETWRAALLKPSERRDGGSAKKAAARIAREIIAASDAPAPKGRMTSDVCEAILIGRWASTRARSG